MNALRSPCRGNPHRWSFARECSINTRIVTNTWIVINAMMPTNQWMSKSTQPLMNENKCLKKSVRWIIINAMMTTNQWMSKSTPPLMNESERLKKSLRRGHPGRWSLALPRGRLPVVPKRKLLQSVLLHLLLMPVPRPVRQSARYDISRILPSPQCITKSLFRKWI